MARTGFLILILVSFLSSCGEKEEEKEVFSYTEIITEVLINQTTKVSPGNYKYWKFAFTTGDKLHCEVKSDSDINVWLLKEREFEAFRRNETFYYYPKASGERVTYLTFDFTIPESGVWYFILDNSFSIFTSKHVTVYLEVKYSSGLRYLGPP